MSWSLFADVMVIVVAVIDIVLIVAVIVIVFNVCLTYDRDLQKWQLLVTLPTRGRDMFASSAHFY